MSCWVVLISKSMRGDVDPFMGFRGYERIALANESRWYCDETLLQDTDKMLTLVSHIRQK
jgi:hypothetical protein